MALGTVVLCHFLGLGVGTIILHSLENRLYSALSPQPRRRPLHLRGCSGGARMVGRSCGRALQGASSIHRTERSRNKVSVCVCVCAGATSNYLLCCVGRRMNVCMITCLVFLPYVDDTSVSRMFAARGSSLYSSRLMSSSQPVPLVKGSFERCLTPSALFLCAPGGREPAHGRRR